MINIIINYFIEEVRKSINKQLLVLSVIEKRQEQTNKQKKTDKIALEWKAIKKCVKF